MFDFEQAFVAVASSAGTAANGLIFAYYMDCTRTVLADHNFQDNYSSENNSDIVAYGPSSFISSKTSQIAETAVDCAPIGNNCISLLENIFSRTSSLNTGHTSLCLYFCIKKEPQHLRFTQISYQYSFIQLCQPSYLLSYLPIFTERKTPFRISFLPVKSRVFAHLAH